MGRRIYLLILMMLLKTESNDYPFGLVLLEFQVLLPELILVKSEFNVSTGTMDLYRKREETRRKYVLRRQGHVYRYVSLNKGQP
jgi:hypothetical protein